jgi:3D (Asp-Asp-Asp) domain-containing protein
MRSKVAVPAPRRAAKLIERAGRALAAAATLSVVAGAASAAASPPAHWPALPGEPVARASALSKPTWLTGVYITEYYPVPESWFKGRRLPAPGLPEPHRVDWLYSAGGVTMQGTGIGLDGRFYHVDRLGIGGWVDRFGRPTSLGAPIFWRAGGFWRNARGALTFPLESGGWSNGVGTRYVPLRGVSFAPGHGRPGLQYYRSLAVDPRLIPMGSRVYVPAYRGRGGGWFVAGDTGGAIIGRHIDVYRSPPDRAKGEYAQSLRNQRILVVPPGARAPAVTAPTAAPAPTSSGDSRGGATGGTAP